MKILLVTETLVVGGAETFVVRLANALSKEHEVVLVNIHPDMSKAELINKVSASVKQYALHIPVKRLFQKLDGLCLRLKVDFSFLEKMIIRQLEKIVSAERPDVVHSHLFKPDYYIAALKDGAEKPFRLVVTNHGDYLLYERTPPRRILNYPSKLQFTLSRVDVMVNISDEQMEFMALLARRLNTPLRLCKIFNGYEADLTEQGSRALLGIKEQDFVYGMVARGIKEKGWQELVEAFTRNSLPDTKLLLVGEGPAIEELKKTYGGNRAVIFGGYSSNPVVFIRLFDVGVLPSYYKAESLPTVIIEYLFCGKPVIASAIGEIPKMLGTDGCQAGTLVPLQPKGIDVEQLRAAMLYFYENKAQYSQFVDCAKKAFAKFEMQECVHRYEAVYRSDSGK